MPSLILLFFLLIIAHSKIYLPCLHEEFIIKVQNQTKEKVRKPGSRGYPPLVFEISDSDDSQAFGVWIAIIILTELMGFNATTFLTESRYNSMGFIERLAKGYAHVDLSVPIQGSVYELNYKKYVIDLKTVIDLDDLGNTWRHGWYLPKYVVDHAQKLGLYPDFWRPYFDNPETVQFFIACNIPVHSMYYKEDPFIPEWCEPYSQNYCVEFISKTSEGSQSVIPQIIRNHNLNMTVVYVGDNFYEIVQEHLERQLCFLFDTISPSREFTAIEEASNGLQRIPLPIGNYKCLENNTAGKPAGKLGFGSVDCDYRSVLSKKFVSASLSSFIFGMNNASQFKRQRMDDYNDLLNYFRGHTLTQWDIQYMLSDEFEGLDSFDVACFWLKEQSNLRWINWLNNSPSYVEEVLYTHYVVVMNIFTALLASCSVILQILLFINREHHIVASSIHELSQLIMIGTYFIFGWVVMRVWMDLVYCDIKDTCAGIGFMLIVGSILLKNYRTHRIFNSSNSYVPEKKKLLMWILWLVLFEVILKLIWHGIDPLNIQQVASVQRESGVVEKKTFYYVCTCNQDILRKFVYFTPKGLLLIIFVYVAFQVRNIRYNNNESARTAFASYTIFFSSIIGFVLNQIDSTMEQNLLYLITSILTLVTVFISTTLLTTSLLWDAYFTPEMNEKDIGSIIDEEIHDLETEGTRSSQVSSENFRYASSSGASIEEYSSLQNKEVNLL